MFPWSVGGWMPGSWTYRPLPGAGDTLRRWRTLTWLTETDIVAGRLAEAHTDAIAILSELHGPPTRPAQLWGVWAAEAPGHRLTARDTAGTRTLDSEKPWCSGAGICSHALVTAHRPDGERALYAIEMADRAITPLAETWRSPGMAGSDTRSVRFADATAVHVGAPGDYLARAGFWFGAMAVAACWLGGARVVAAPLYRAVADQGRAADPHAQAHLGAVDAALAAAAAILTCAAGEVDAEPDTVQAELIARRVRRRANRVAAEIH